MKDLVVLCGLIGVTLAGPARADEPAEFEPLTELEPLDWMIGEWKAPLPDREGYEVATWRRTLGGRALVGEFREEMGGESRHVSTTIVMPTPGENTITSYGFDSDLNMIGSQVGKRGDDYRWNGVMRTRAGQVLRGRLEQTKVSDDVYTAQLLLAGKDNNYTPLGPVMRLVRVGSPKDVEEPQDKRPSGEAPAVAATQPGPAGNEPTGESLAELEALAGEYERYWGPEPKRRSVKRIEGATETIIFYDGAGNELDRHTVDIEVAIVGGVRVLTHRRVESAHPIDTVSYVYRLENGDFVEARGLHEKDPRPVGTYRWKRVSPSGE